VPYTNSIHRLSIMPGIIGSNGGVTNLWYKIGFICPSFTQLLNCSLHIVELITYICIYPVPAAHNWDKDSTYSGCGTGHMWHLYKRIIHWKSFKWTFDKTSRISLFIKATKLDAVSWENTCINNTYMRAYIHTYIRIHTCVHTIYMYTQSAMKMRPILHLL
jgi:hypothetical protein